MLISELVDPTIDKFRWAPIKFAAYLFMFSHFRHKNGTCLFQNSETQSSECITAMAASGNDIVPRLLENSPLASKWFTVLCNHLSLVYLLEANSPPTGFLSAAALDHLKSDESTPSMWFKWINAPRFQDSCVQIQQIDNPVRACKLSHTSMVSDLYFSTSGIDVLSVGRQDSPTTKSNT
jgi:hypothetical protein